MFFKRIESKGLAHFSYMVGEGGELAVIDPRRDVGVYLETARTEGARIIAIFETHRNEDYIVGSQELHQLTGATVYLSGHEDLGHVYGERIRDGFEVKIGELTIRALHTPGHTLGHMAYAVFEKDRETPWLVFTGDSLFIGDMARTDFYGEAQLDKMTGLLYDSVFEKLLPLGDDVLVLPAHGAGSACGQSMEERPYSTLGYERRYNAQLQDGSKAAFIQRFARTRVRPEYFDQMRRYNVRPPQPLGLGWHLPALTMEAAVSPDHVLVDLRPKEAFFGGHIPGSLYMNPANLAVFLGAILDLDTPIVFLLDSGQVEHLEEIYFQSRRVGFEQIRGFITTAIEDWQTQGRSLATLATVSATEFLELQRTPATDYVLLDVRKDHESEAGDPQTNRLPIPLEELHGRNGEIPRDRPVYVLCASGNRATTAGSLLQKLGCDVTVITGGVKGLRELMA